MSIFSSRQTPLVTADGRKGFARLGNGGDAKLFTAMCSPAQFDIDLDGISEVWVQANPGGDPAYFRLDGQVDITSDQMFSITPLVTIKLTNRKQIEALTLVGSVFVQLFYGIQGTTV